MYYCIIMCVVSGHNVPLSPRQDFDARDILGRKITLRPHHLDATLDVFEAEIVQPPASPITVPDTRASSPVGPPAAPLEDPVPIRDVKPEPVIERKVSNGTAMPPAQLPPPTLTTATSMGSAASEESPSGVLSSFLPLLCRRSVVFLFSSPRSRQASSLRR